ncbi:MAG: hypothetical protein CSA65_00025 [Proteobacteria bacterium]|nr:MAG: hypothetical protein CSA65_00025 [Pseudomonadota bacterium]
MLELSGFGRQRVTLQLGPEFHNLRKRPIASQIAHLAAAKREEFGYAGRRRRVFELPESESLDKLLGPQIPFFDLPTSMHTLYRGEAASLAPLLVYGGGDTDAGQGSRKPECTP